MPILRKARGATASSGYKQDEGLETGIALR